MSEPMDISSLISALEHILEADGNMVVHFSGEEGQLFDLDCLSVRMTTDARSSKTLFFHFVE
jgi:hypothetical protein